MSNDSLLHRQLIRLASSETLPSFDHRHVGALLYRLLMDKSDMLSSTCQATLLTVIAMLIREEVEQADETAERATRSILERLKR